MPQPTGFSSWQHYFDSHIAECDNCAPYLQGEGQISVEGEETDRRTAFFARTSERLWKQVVANGRCQGCKGIVAGMTTVWARLSSEVEFQRKVEGIIRRRRPKLEEFRNFLVKHPSLGASHPTGHSLMRAIGRIRPSCFGGEWYRCMRERGGCHPLS